MRTSLLIQDAHLSGSELRGFFTQPHIETKTARCTVRVRVFFLAEAAVGV